ncbi:Tl.2 family protein [Megaselia abdita]
MGLVDIIVLVITLSLFLPVQNAALLDSFCKKENEAFIRIRQSEFGLYSAQVCSDFKLDFYNTNGRMMLSSNSDIVVFRNCKINGFNDLFVSLFPNIFRLSLENCVINLTDSNGPPENSLYSLHIFNSTVLNNAKTSSFKGFKNLRNFYAIDTKFENPEIESSIFNANMYRIVFSNCNLRKMFTSYESNELIFLEVDGNSLKEPISYTPIIMDSYNFANNNLSKLPSSMDIFKNDGSLKTLNVSNNQIELDELSQKHLETFTKLEILDLSRNSRIATINTDAFKNCENLQHLNISNCKLESVFDNLQNLKNLKILDLSFNKLHEIQDIWSLKNVSEIYLQYNNLKFFFCGNNLPSSLKILDVSYNKILTFTS